MGNFKIKMVTVKDVKVGHLLVSSNYKLHCVTQILLDKDCPDRSLITGVDEKGIKHAATPRHWYKLTDPLIDISKIKVSD